jgi:hypothetical protein
MAVTTPRPPDHTTTTDEPPTVYIEVEWHLRAAGRGLEVPGVTEPDATRLAGVCFRLAQRIAVDSGRLELAA